MASKKGDGGAGVTAEMVEILRLMLAEQRTTNARLDRIESEAKQTNVRLATVEGRLGAVESKLDTLHEDMIEAQAGQASIRNELGGLRGEAFADLRDVKRRLEALERAVFPTAAE
jgi:hypothetical protein